MGTLVQDVRYGIRMLAKSPGFAAIAIVTLALGIGANTAMFSVVNAVLLRPLPFPEPDRLVTIWGTHSKLNEMSRALSYPDIADLQSMNTAFDNVAAYNEATVTLTGVGESLHVNAADVSSNMFSALRVSPILGRAFAPGEDRAGNFVVILSYGLWQTRFHGDPNVIGHSVEIEGRSHTIIGVMPRGFAFPLDSNPPQLWRTYAALATPVNRGEKPQTEVRQSHFLAAIARLKPGVTMEQASQDAQMAGMRLEKQYPDTNRYLGFRAEPALSALVGDIQPQLYILLGAVGLVLLIGCANVANLLLARATGRQREIALRAALGASRARIVRQLLIESGILSIAGGACGLLVAEWGTEFFARVASDQVPRLAMATIDLRVLAFTLIASIGTGLVFGVAPALQLSGLELTETLKESGRGAGHSVRQSRLRSLLVAWEMTLAVMLLTGAGLLIKSLSKLENVNPGFNPHGVIAYSIDLPDVRYPQPEQAEAFFRQLYRRVGEIPGVESASGTTPLPLSNDAFRTVYEVEGRPAATMDEPHVHFRAIGTDYFHTMQISLLQGRDFSAADRADQKQVAIVNQKFVLDAFPNENPIGKRIKPEEGLEKGSPWREIVGVVGNVKHLGLNRADTAECYVPEDQIGFSSMSGVVRTNLSPAAAIPVIREQVKAIDPDVPIYDVKSMDDYLSASVAIPRLDSTMLGIFAGLALVLAIVGIYGVMSYGVAQRTSEIGIRMTLGAQRSDVLRLVLRQGLTIAVAGVAIGILGALGASQLLSKLLFGVSPFDPLTFAGVALSLVSCALLACYLPAWRATRVDPLVALRYE